MIEKIKCPDCQDEVKEVVVERYQMKTFTVDYENKKLVPVYKSEWETDDDYAIRCSNCDSLNMDEFFNNYCIQEPDEPVKIDDRIQNGPGSVATYFEVREKEGEKRNWKVDLDSGTEVASNE